MDLKDIKKALAGVCVATLLSGAGLTLTGAASGWGSQSGAGGEQKKESGKSGWSASQPGAGSVEEEKKEPGKSSWSGTKPGAGSTEEEKKEPGKSSWSGTKK